MGKPRFEIFVGKNNKWYWRCISTNGKITAPSEGYYSKGNAVRAIYQFIRSMWKINSVTEVKIKIIGK